MEFKDEKKAFERERICRIVEEGSKSEYWQILSGEVKRHLDKYDNYLERMDSKRLTAQELQERNEIIFQRKFMKWFLNINEKLLKDQETFFSKLKNSVENLYRNMETFVRN